MRKLHLILMAFVLLVFANGCSKQKAAENPNNQPAQTSPSTAQQPMGSVDANKNTPDVDDLELGRAIDASTKKVTDGTDDFKPNDTIYVSVKTDGAAANSEVKVRWTYENGQLVKEDKRTVAAGGDAWTEFHISKPSGFPKGDYKVTAYVNGDDKGSKTFEVK